MILQRHAAKFGMKILLTGRTLCKDAPTGDNIITSLNPDSTYSTVTLLTFKPRQKLSWCYTIHYGSIFPSITSREN